MNLLEFYKKHNINSIYELYNNKDISYKILNSNLEYGYYIDKNIFNYEPIKKYII